MANRKCTFALDGPDGDDFCHRRKAVVLQTIADANLVGVGLGTLDGGVELANDEMLRMMGVSRADYAARGVAWDERIAPESQEEHRRTISSLRRGEVTRYECVFQQPDGERTHFLGASVLIDDDSGSYASVAVDVTEQHRSKREADKANQRKDRFLAVLAHELRGPLATARFALTTLADGASEPARARRILERQVEHLAHLTSQLDHISRIGAGKLLLERRPLDLTVFACAVVEDHTALYAEAGVRLEGPRAGGVPCPLRADETRLRQCIGNLLSNAIKFTKRGGCVRVEVESRDGSGFLRVTDDGDGLESEQIDRLFDPFEQRESTIRFGEAGLGLGLAIVQGIVELHGGTVSVASDGPGMGTSFEVRLPLDALPA